MYLLSIQEENVSCGMLRPLLKAMKKKAFFKIVILLTLNSINTF